MIEMGKKYRTRAGQEVRIYAVDGGGAWPVHGAVQSSDPAFPWHLKVWTEDGRASTHPTLERPEDLFEVLPEVTVRREVFFDAADNSVFTVREGTQYRDMPCLGGINITHNGKEIIRVEVVK